MPDERAPSVLGGLPRTRPHRRSEKRTAAASPQAEPAQTEPAPNEAKAKTRAKPNKSAAAKPKAPGGKTRAPSPKPKTPNGKTPTPAAKAKTPEATVSAARRRGTTMRQPAQPRGAPMTTRPVKRPPASATPQRPANGREIVGTAVQAAAELAEIGLAVSARAIRTAVSRLPRP